MCNATMIGVIWGSCGKILVSELERIHVRAAKLIYSMDWYTPSEEVLARAGWTTIGHMYSQKMLLLAYKGYLFLFNHYSRNVILNTT